ncbi:MAG: hypothetical protein Q8M92_09155, partial [Candidatus Subteraquimicrobiales bacterium]|nr:hypothetical protein [Candidatus Subteraquimicrobiales bacterium]
LQGSSNYAFDRIMGQREASAPADLIKEICYAGAVGFLGGLTFGGVGGGIVRAHTYASQVQLRKLADAGNADAKTLLESRKLIEAGKGADAYSVAQPIIAKAESGTLEKNTHIALELARQRDAFVIAGFEKHPMTLSKTLEEAPEDIVAEQEVVTEEQEVTEQPVASPLDEAISYLEAVDQGKKVEAVAEPVVVETPAPVAVIKKPVAPRAAPEKVTNKPSAQDVKEAIAQRNAEKGMPENSSWTMPLIELRKRLKVTKKQLFAFLKDIEDRLYPEYELGFSRNVKHKYYKEFSTISRYDDLAIVAEQKDKAEPKIVSIEWKSSLQEVPDKIEGVTVARRSDWDNAEVSEISGREIV